MDWDDEEDDLVTVMITRMAAMTVMMMTTVTMTMTMTVMITVSDDSADDSDGNLDYNDDHYHDTTMHEHVLVATPSTSDKGQEKCDLESSPRLDNMMTKCHNHSCVRHTIFSYVQHALGSSKNAKGTPALVNAS